MDKAQLASGPQGHQRAKGGVQRKRPAKVMGAGVAGPVRAQGCEIRVAHRADGVQPVQAAASVLLLLITVLLGATAGQSFIYYQF